MKYQNARIDPENRLINDADYAKQMGYKNLFALPTFAPHSNVDKAFPPAARDTILANQLNGNITSYLPIYPGDTLYLVINKRTIRDIRPQKETSTAFLPFPVRQAYIIRMAKRLTIWYGIYARALTALKPVTGWP